jgi:hypothetical protein
MWISTTSQTKFPHPEVTVFPPFHVFSRKLTLYRSRNGNSLYFLRAEYLHKLFWAPTWNIPLLLLSLLFVHTYLYQYRLILFHTLAYIQILLTIHLQNDHLFPNSFSEIFWLFIVQLDSMVRTDILRSFGLLNDFLRAYMEIHFLYCKVL